MMSFEEFGRAFGMVIDDGSREFDTLEEANDYITEDDPREIYFDWKSGKYKIDSWEEYYLTH